MNKIILLFSVLIISVLGACGQPISSFEGYFISVNTNNELEFDCSEAAKRNQNSDTEEGYVCNVEINEHTTIRTKDGESLSVDELKKWEFLDKPKKAKVILSEEKDINTNMRSREGLNASEIIILN